MKAKIVVEPDEFGVDYQEMLENMGGKFCAFHRRSDLGHLNRDDASEYLRALDGDELRVPIFLYQHSGMVLSTTPFSCPWDSGQVGVWVYTKEEIADIFGDDSTENRKKLLESIEGCVGILNAVIGGDVWGYKIIDFDGEVADSCCGFIGDTALEDMKCYVPENRHAELEKAWENRYA